MYGLIDVLLNGHVIIQFLFIIIIILLLILRDKCSIKKLLILNLIPVIIGLIHFIIFYFKGNIQITFSYFDVIYLSSFLFLFVSLFIKKKRTHRLLTILLIPICLICIFLTGITITRYYTIHNYTKDSYTTSFKKMIKTLKKEYVLNDWKKIDYEELEKEYLPLIEQAEKNKDESLYYETIFKFMDNFKDGHAGVNCLNNTCKETMKKYDLNNYYGFDTVLLDDGRIIAIKVDKDSDAYKKGLRDNYTIIARESKDILEYLDDYYYHRNGEPVEYNERLINSTKIWMKSLKMMT